MISPILTLIFYLSSTITFLDLGFHVDFYQPEQSLPHSRHFDEYCSRACIYTKGHLEDKTCHEKLR